MAEECPMASFRIDCDSVWYREIVTSLDHWRGSKAKVQ